MKGDRATTVGKIPTEIWDHQKWFIGKLQWPLFDLDKKPPALIYDRSRNWSLYVPTAWIAMIKMPVGAKGYYWMWFDERHVIHIEQGTKVTGANYW